MKRHHYTAWVTSAKAIKIPLGDNAIYSRSIIGCDFTRSDDGSWCIHFAFLFFILHAGYVDRDVIG